MFNYSKDGGKDGLKDPSLLGTNYENYIIFGEAYLNYDMQGLGTKTVAKLGYQRYDTPMVGSDDVRMVPNTFEAYKFVNKDVNNVTLEVAQIMSIAYGTFSNIFGNPSLDGATSGYSSLGAKAVGTGGYLNIGDAAVGKSTNGITNLKIKYKTEHLHIDISNDYAWDLYNTLYIDTGTSWDCLLNKNVHLFIKAQVIKQNSVGEKYMQYSPLSTQGNGNVDSLFGAVKIGAKYEGLTAYAAYSELSANSAGDESYKNAILSQFGGSPAYTQAMVIRNQFIAGTKAYKLEASYSFKNQGTDISTALYYASFDMDMNSGFGDARTATEPGFNIKYYPKAVKKLQLRFRGNFPRKFLSDSTGWDEYRLIANYNF